MEYNHVVTVQSVNLSAFYFFRNDVSISCGGNQTDRVRSQGQSASLESLKMHPYLESTSYQLYRS